MRKRTSLKQELTQIGNSVTSSPVLGVWGEPPPTPPRGRAKTSPNSPHKKTGTASSAIPGSYSSVQSV